MTNTARVLPTRCLACDSELDFPLFCEGCRRLYPLPASTDYFSLLGLERAYAIDEDSLRAKVLALSRSVHPDYFGGESDQMRQLAVQLSAEVNEAAHVLLDPVLRAGYLLKLAGGAPESDRRAVCPEVLGEVMTLREQVETAGTSGETSATDRLRAQVQDRRDSFLAGISKLAQRLPNISEPEKSQLQTLLNSISYYDNLLETCEKGGTG